MPEKRICRFTPLVLFDLMLQIFEPHHSVQKGTMSTNLLSNLLSKMDSEEPFISISVANNNILEFGIPDLVEQAILQG